MITDADRVPIGRRSWIGDGRHGASLAADATIDWYCPAGISAEPDLWRLLDPAGAAVRVGPVRGGASATLRLPDAAQSFLAGTNVVDTVLEAGAGRRASVVDFLPWPGPGLEVPAMIVRLVRALSGPLDVEVEVLAGPRRAFGGPQREVAAAGGRLVLGSTEVCSPGAFRCEPLGRDVERWRAVFRLGTAEEAVVTVGPRGAAGGGVGLDAAHRLLSDTVTAWRSWLGPLRYDGPYREAVERALLYVRSLTGPAGAPLAAGTSSLPRRVGSERSSDQRWVRVRDAALAANLLAAMGMEEDALAAEEWLRACLPGAGVPWPSWLEPGGGPVPDPGEWAFPGWRRSQPVGSGRPPGPVDLGLVGRVVAAAVARPGGPLDDARRALGSAADWAADHWRERDGGMWEIARPLRAYTASRVFSWGALEGMAGLARAANPLDLEAVGWRSAARDVSERLEEEAVAPDGGLGMEPGSDEPDAALLAVAWSGPWPTWHPVVAATVERVLERLSSGPLLHRYPERVADEQAGPDNPDLEASFMAVRALGRLGRWDEAHERMERLVALAPTIAETADPVSGEVYGDFPATGVALALAGAANSLQEGPK